VEVAIICVDVCDVEVTILVFGAGCVLITVIVKNNRKSVRRVLGDATRETFVIRSKDATRITLTVLFRVC
jgi:hypothetical protein